MKKKYSKPALEEPLLVSAPLMLTISNGGQEEEIIGNANSRRGIWGNLWNNDEE